MDLFSASYQQRLTESKQPTEKKNTSKNEAKIVIPHY